MKNDMVLVDFILKAKLAGYATSGEGQERKFSDGSCGFELISGGYKYLDRYYGFNPFIGTEKIYNEKSSLIWAMNYFGEISPEYSEPKKVYSFLKDAMRAITIAYPFRGPAKLENEELRYENLQNGNVDSFHGTESIYKGNEKVYRLHYHGGKMTVTTRAGDTV